MPTAPKKTSAFLYLMVAAAVSRDERGNAPAFEPPPTRKGEREQQQQQYDTMAADTCASFVAGA